MHFLLNGRSPRNFFSINFESAILATRTSTSTSASAAITFVRVPPRITPGFTVIPRFRSFVDTLMRLMELRRWLKDLRIVAARRRGERIVLEFAAATPVRTDTLLETVRRSRGSLRLLDGSTLAIAPEATDHDGTIAEVRALLQRLSAA